MLPDYGGGCLSNLLDVLLGPGGVGPSAGVPPPWLPEGVAGAAQVVVLVLDGLGWQQLQDRAEVAPCLAGLTGGPITSVVPTTTATALTSITTGLPPAVHEVVGYRVRVGRDEVLNVLRWRTASGEQHEEQEWFTVVAWDRLADICYSLLKKDILVYIEGPVHTRSWKDDNGVTRSIIEVVADDMRVLCDHNLPVAQADDDESIDSYAFCYRIAENCTSDF